MTSHSGGTPAGFRAVTRRHWPDLGTLDLLVRAADHGSIGKAAAEVGISQASASRRLDTLERELGITLLSRSARGSKPTPQGQVVVDWARTALQSVLDLLSGVDALRHDRWATLRVAASMTVAEYLVPTWLMKLRALSGQAEVNLTVANSARVQELVEDGSVELGFIECPDAPRQLASRRVASDRLMVVVAPSHPWAKRTKAIDSATLAGTPLVVRESGSGTRTSLEHAMESMGLGVAIALELSSNSAIKVAVESGAAPAVLSDLAVAAEVRDGRLVELAVDDVPLVRPLRAVWQRHQRLTAGAADLIAIAAAGGAAGRTDPRSPSGG